MLGEQGSRQLSAFVCVHQPDGFKDLLIGDFCCRRLFVLPELGFCRGQVIGLCQRELVGARPLHLAAQTRAFENATFGGLQEKTAETLAKKERAGRCQLSWYNYKALKNFCGFYRKSGNYSSLRF